MSNLGRTQADWRKLFRELGLFLAPQRELREVARRFDLRRTATRVSEVNDVNASTSEWHFSGAKIGANTDEAGILYVRIASGVPAAGQAQVSIFKATGGGAQDLVAQGAGAPGSVIALASQNGSGLAGSVKLGPAPATENDDKHKLVLFPDWAARMHQVLDGSEPEHGALLEAFMAALDSAEKAVTQALTAFATATDAYLGTRWKNFQRSSQTTPIQKTTENDQGSITSQAAGLLEDGRDNMADELTAGPQTVARVQVTATAAVFDATNKGKGSLAAPAMTEFARPGRVTGTCTDATLGQERFALAQHLDQTGEDRAAENEITVRRPFSDPEIGIKAAFLDRILTLDSGSPDDFGAPAGWLIQGEDSRNADQGRISLKVVASGTAFQIEGYTSSSFDHPTQVFATAPGQAGASVPILAANNSGLSGTAVLGAKPTAGHTGALNLNPFALGDKFVIDITAASRGGFQHELALLYGYALASDDPKNATIDDRYVTAGTLPAFEDAP